MFELSDTGHLKKLNDYSALRRNSYLHHESQLREGPEIISPGENGASPITQLQVEEPVAEARQQNLRSNMSLWVYYIESYGLRDVVIWALWASVTAALEQAPGIVT